jgi:hypothetical protein
MIPERRGRLVIESMGRHLLLRLAIGIPWDQQAVPVDRGRNAELVADAHLDATPPKPKRGTEDRP